MKGGLGEELEDEKRTANDVRCDNVSSSDLSAKQGMNIRRLGFTLAYNERISTS